MSKISKIDRPTIDNVYHVSEFVGEIHNSMLQIENKWNANPHYMAGQQKINE